MSGPTGIFHPSKNNKFDIEDLDEEPEELYAHCQYCLVLIPQPVKVWLELRMGQYSLFSFYEDE